MNTKKRKIQKRNDIILIVVLFIFVIMTIVLMVLEQEDGARVLVKIDGQIEREFSLFDDTTYNIEFEDGCYNVLVIEDGYVQIIEASCPDQICVKHREISKSGETIVCLPNKLVIEIDSEYQSEIDGIAN